MQFGLPGTLAGHAFNTIAFVPGEGIGLGIDEGIDAFKCQTVSPSEKIGDEGQPGSINPLHSFLPKSLQWPVVYLPGLHRDGKEDFSW